MQGLRITRGFLVLAGIGLLLVGLTGGIFFMLLVEPHPSAPAPSTGWVSERIALGRRSDMRQVGVLDSSLSPAMAEAVTLNTLFREVSRVVTPAVVFIQVETIASGNAEWYHDFDGDLRDRLYRDPLPRQSVGSGVIISEEGYIITNNHVVDNASTIQVTLTDKRQYPARVVGIDPSTDLAVIKIENTGDLPVIEFGDSDAVMVGDWVLAIGNPFRLTSTVTAGIVSALGRQVNIIEDHFGIEDFIQTDAAINPGNSGGALVNLRGQLIGISTAIATEGGSYEGYGFAVPVNLMDRVARDLIAYGEVKRGFLGVTIQEIGSAEARRLGLSRVNGVYLDEVQQGGAADRAGLKKGDVLLAIGGLRVDAPNELQRTVARYRPGDRLAVEVWRRGVRRHYEVELLGSDDPSYQNWFSELRQGARPPTVPDLGGDPAPPPREDAPRNYQLPRWGLALQDVTDRERDAFEVVEGAYIAYTTRGGVGAEAGLPRDAVIIAVGDHRVGSVQDVIRALDRQAAEDESVVLRVKRRDGITAFYELDVPGAG